MTYLACYGLKPQGLNPRKSRLNFLNISVIRIESSELNKCLFRTFLIRIDPSLILVLCAYHGACLYLPISLPLGSRPPF